MGRYDLRPQSVLRSTQLLINAGRLTEKPLWYDAVADIAPAATQTSVRPPKRHESGRKKAQKIYQPVKLRFPEDSLRRDFYGDHPWELARPRVILEQDGKDYQKLDWSKLGQVGKALDGERYVCRPLSSAWCVAVVLVPKLSPLV